MIDLGFTKAVVLGVREYLVSHLTNRNYALVVLASTAENCRREKDTRRRDGHSRLPLNDVNTAM